jgi:hypothetical protein
MVSGKIGGSWWGGGREGFLHFATFVFVAEYQEREKVVISS